MYLSLPISEQLSTRSDKFQPVQTYFHLLRCIHTSDFTARFLAPENTLERKRHSVVSKRMAKTAKTQGKNTFRIGRVNTPLIIKTNSVQFETYTGKNLGRGARYLTGEKLKVVWLSFQL